MVIAVIDRGINPYHEVYAGEAWAPPGTATKYLSTEGSFADRRGADAALWAGIGTDQLVRFNGTRVLAMSFTNDTPTHILDDNGHGTGTSSTVAQAAPNATIIMLEVAGVACGTELSCIGDPALARALQWASEQPWIDIITVSLGFAGAPDTGVIHPEVAAYQEASRLAVANGKLHLQAAGNYPIPTLYQPWVGLPGVIAVGGTDPPTKGEVAISSKFVDVVSNFTMFVATHTSTTEMVERSGTSLSTPLVAGTLGAALDIIRASGTPQIVPLREAMNLSAIQWAPTDWSPLASEPGALILNPTVPVLVAPAQQGWGMIEPALAPEIAAVALGATPQHPPNELTTAWMAQYQALRETLYG